MSARESHRVKEADKKRVLDEASRNRRARKALEALEQDNFHDDPHADLVMSKKVPKFHDSLEQSRGSQRSKQNKRKTGDFMKAKYRKNFGQLLEEDKQLREATANGGGAEAGGGGGGGGGGDGGRSATVRATYADAQAPPSLRPERHFCAVCGFASAYTCTSCGTRYCSCRCLATHRDTRCLKWTA